MTEKRFSLSKDTEWWFVQDNAIQVNKYGYRDDLTGEDEYRGLHQELTEQETVDLLNELAEENKQLKFENNELKCALALGEVDYIIADGKKIDIPPYYEFEQRYDHVIHRREYDGYD